MKKILVVGRSGSGKTTFSEKLGKALGRKVIHLDNLFWKPGWVRAFNTAEWEKVIQELISEDEWILDGNYHNTLDMRLRRADAVFLLETNPFQSFLQALKRKYFPPSQSADTVLGLHDEVGLWPLAKSIFRFPAKQLRKKIINSGIKNVFIINNQRDLDKVFDSLI